MYLIEKHHIDISCSNLETAKQIQNEIGDVFQHKLYSRLNDLLEKYVIDDSIWKIEKLNINIPNLVLSNWKNDLVDSILVQTEAFLKDNQPQVRSTAAKTEQGELVSLKRKYQDLLLDYLVEGKLTTNAITTDLSWVFKMVSLDRDFENLLIEKLKDSNQLIHVVLRVLFNLPDELKSKLADKFEINRSLKTLEDILKNQPKSSAALFKFLLWKSSFINKGLRASKNNLGFYETHFNLSKSELLLATEKWESALRTQHISDNRLLKILSKEVSSLKIDIYESDSETDIEERTSTRNEIEAVLEALQDDKQTASAENYNYIKNAGLVILHPFLVQLFSPLGYLEDTNWKEERLRHRAVLLLHYLIYGKSKIFENELIINKIICGVGISDTVNTTWKITKVEKYKCEELLSSVIKHWSILKDTSVKTLQETFLQREAKLKTYKEGKYELVVKQQSIDILLDHLPWGIGMVKTPWMEQYLTCRWT